MLIFEPTRQQGLLATKYQRVYFTDGTAQTETLPDKRFKIPIGTLQIIFSMIVLLFVFIIASIRTIGDYELIQLILKCR